MKCYLILVGFFFHRILTLNITNDCEQNDNEEHWICEKNQDNTINLTYDCSLNENKTFEFELWHFPFPNTMKALNIQNCDRLVLDSVCSPFYKKRSKTFSYLHILNISEFFLTKNRGLLQLEEDDYYTAWRKSRRPGILPENIVFQNIKSAEFGVELFTDKNMLEGTCNLKVGEAQVKILRFINVTIDRLERLWHDTATSKNMTELILKNVTINHVLDKAVHLHSKNAKIEITNSIFNNLDENFAEYKVSKVLISQNIFNELNEKIFKGDSEEFVFTRNKIVTSTDTTAFDIRSRIVVIVNNTFHDIHSHFINGIKGILLSRNLNGENFPSLLNFSNNIVYFLAADSLAYEDENSADNYFFGDLIVKNNLFLCSCNNLMWFDYLKTSAVRNLQTKIFRYHLINKDNGNGCLNIEKCGLNKALFNPHEFLCSKNQKCPNVSMSLKHLYEEELYFEQESFLQQTNVSSQNFSGISKEIRDALKIQGQSFSLEVQKIVQYLEPMLSCIYVTTILFCFSLGFVIVRRCSKLPFYKVRSIIRRFRNFCMNRPAEVSMSCVSLDA